MSLVAMVYYVLMAQSFVLAMLCLPYARNVIVYLGRFIPLSQIKWYILLTIGIVAFMSEEAFRKMYKLQIEVASLDRNDPHFLEQKEAKTPLLLRAQRDTYICGFALFFCFVVPSVYKLVAEHQQLSAGKPPAEGGAPQSHPPKSPRVSKKIE